MAPSPRTKPDSELKGGKILIVDDEVELTNAVCEMLPRHGYEVVGFNSGPEALAHLREEGANILLADLMMPEMDGITLLKKALEIDPFLIGVIMTGQGTIQTAVEAIKTGAYDYVLKPFKLNAILSVLARALELRRMKEENDQLREMLTIYELGQVITLTLDLDVILNKIADAALQQCRADEVSILLAEPEAHRLQIAVMRGAERQYLIGQSVPLEGSIAGWVASNRQALILEGEVRDDRFNPLYPRPEIRSAIAEPLVVGNKLVGVINVNTTHNNGHISSNQIRVMSILASIAASAIENARLYNAVQKELAERERRELELEAVASVSAALRASLSQAEMLPVILDEVSGVLQAEAAALAIRNDRNGELVIQLGRGEWSERAGERIPPGEGISSLVIASGKPYFSNHIQDEPLYTHPELIGALQAIACAPLIARGQLLGVIWIARRQEITENEVQLLTSMSDIAASAIQQASLFEQTENRLRRISALRTIDLAISSSLDLRITLNVLLDQVSANMGVDAAAVLLFDPSTQGLETTTGRGFRTRLIENLHAFLEDGYAGTAALQRRTIQVTDIAEAESDPALASLFAAEDFHACFATPLIAKGELEGVLVAFQRSPLHPDPEWLEFLEALAGQAAIAIDSARLFDNLQRTNQQLLSAYNATIEGWSRALDLRDKETEGHTQRVTEMTLKLARAVGGFDDEELITIRWGGLLHDIGKMGIPDEILLKPGALTEEEWDIMRKHPVYAYQLLAPIHYLRKSLDIPYCHHEHWDGTGYPRGLKGEQIPLAARIFALADVWDALRSDRPYRPSWPEEQVLEYIRGRAGSQFDPHLVEEFLKFM